MSSGNNVERKVPAGWSVTELSQIVPKAQYGISSSLDEGKGIPVLRMNNLHDGYIDISDVKFSTSPEAANLLLQPNDVLFNRTNSMDHVGRTSLWRGELAKASFASYLVRLIPDPNRLDAEYLVRWLNLPQVQIAIRCFATPGVHQVNINPTNLRKTEICLPEDVREQRKINKILTKLDNMIEKTESLIAKYQAIKQGMMHDLFTRGVNAHGHLRPPQTEVPDLYKQSELGWIPKEWGTRQLQQMVRPDSPITYGVVQPGPEDIDGVLFVRGGDIFDGELFVKNLRTISRRISAGYKRTLLAGGEIVVSLVGYPGEAAIVPTSLAGANIARQAALIRLRSEFDSGFLTNYLLSTVGKGELFRNAVGSAQQVINLSDLNFARIATPTIDEQKRIAASVRRVRASIKSESIGLAQQRDIKTGLMQDLLTGKVRVKMDKSDEVVAHA